MTGCSRAYRVRPRGSPPPRAVRSAAASRTRTRGSRAAGRPTAPLRPRRSAAVRRRDRRSPHERHCLGVLTPAVPPSRSRRCRGPRTWSTHNTYRPGVIAGGVEIVWRRDPYPLAPDVAGGLDDEAELGHLLVVAQRVTLHR